MTGDQMITDFSELCDLLGGLSVDATRGHNIFLIRTKGVIIDLIGYV